MENLYETLNEKVNANVANADNLKEEKRKALMDSQYREAVYRNNYSINTTMAYYYYRYFIANILPILIKDSINNSFDDLNTKDIKQKTFDYKIQVSKNRDHIEQFMKSSNVFYISFGNFIVYKEFINYLNAFCLRNGIDITNEYPNSQVYYFDNMTLGDMLNAYYGELQRLEYTDELIDSIQEEENTYINGEELTKNIKSR